MIKKFRATKIFSLLGPWVIPISVVTSLIPMLSAQWLPPTSKSATPATGIELPPPPQIEPVQSLSPPTPPEDIAQALREYAARTGMPAPRGDSNEKQVKPISPSAHSSTAGQKSSGMAKKSSPGTGHRTRHAKAPSSYTAPQLEIKVAIADGASNLTLGTSTSASILDAQGKFLQTVPANQGLQVQAAGSSLSVGNWQLPGVVWVQPARGGAVYVGDRWYRGRLLLVSEGSAVLAVNYVDLEHYLYSVVGSEMHAAAPMEALKAQAIAARSYALVHMIRPASQWYHLGSTERWQAYKGVDREFNTTQKAVRETAGQILSYRGGVVESLYAANQEIVDNAHGGRGMSQTGAYDLAAQGYNYQQILGYYYPGVGLARLVLKQ